MLEVLYLNLMEINKIKNIFQVKFLEVIILIHMGISQWMLIEVILEKILNFKNGDLLSYFAIEIIKLWKYIIQTTKQINYKFIIIILFSLFNKYLI